MGSNEDWVAWGRVDPNFGVSSIPGKELTSDNPWTREQILELGRAHWQGYRAQWSQYGLDPESCVEIGCGVGRITAQLAESFQRVFALDVSPDMIEQARQGVPSSVEFHLTTGADIPLPADLATAAFSSFVFQHFDRRATATAYFRELYRVLKPGGTLLIQLPLYAWPVTPRLFESQYKARKRLGDLRSRYRRWRAGRGGRPNLRFLAYDAEGLRATLEELGFRDVEFRIFRIPKAQRPQSAVLARKPSGRA